MKRDDVVKGAKAYIGIGEWTPVTDTVTFEEIPGRPVFESAYTKSPAGEGLAAPSYRVVPYVYGGFDTVTELRTRIARSDIAPGGWDKKTGKTTSDFVLRKGGVEIVRGEQEHQVEREVKQTQYIAGRRMAGIDCSGFVSRSWQLRSKQGTSTIPQMCLQVARTELRPGDVLNKAGSHVVLFAGWSDQKMTAADVYESQGGGKKRPFREGDTVGQVVHHTRKWEWFTSNGYVALSPFPQLVRIEPGPATYDRSASPISRIVAECAGSGTIEGKGMAIDGTNVAFTSRPGQDMRRQRRIVTVTHDLHSALGPGRHVVTVAAVNAVAGQSFEATLEWDFALL